MVFQKIKQLFNNKILNRINDKKFLKYYIPNKDGYIITPKGHRIKYIKDPFCGIERIIESKNGLFFTSRWDTYRNMWVTYPKHIDYVEDHSDIIYEDLSSDY